MRRSLRAKLTDCILVRVMRWVHSVTTSIRRAEIYLIRCTSEEKWPSDGHLASHNRRKWDESREGGYLRRVEITLLMSNYAGKEIVTHAGRMRMSGLSLSTGGAARSYGMVSDVKRMEARGRLTPPPQWSLQYCSNSFKGAYCGANPDPRCC